MGGKELLVKGGVAGFCGGEFAGEKGEGLLGTVEVPL